MPEGSDATIPCDKCGRANPPDFSFCPVCAEPTENRARFESEESRLLSKLQAYIDERLKDAKAVEIGIAEAAATRISSWVKLFGVFAGIPAALLLATLAALGITSFLELKNKEAAATQLVDGVQQQASKLETQLEESAVIQNRVSSLTRRVNRLETFKLVTPAGVPKATWDSFLDRLYGFEDYLDGLGYLANGTRMFSVAVVDNPNQIFKVGDAAIDIDRRYIASTDVFLEAYFVHALRSQARGISFQPDVRKDQLPWSLGVYFVCSFNNSPQFRYTQSDALDLGKEERLHPGEPLAHALWTIRQAIGSDISDRLFFASLTNVRAESENAVAAFAEEVEKQDAQMFQSSHKAAIRGAFSRAIF